MGRINNKWINGAIPALLIHCSVGSVYAWSLFVNPISELINKNTSIVQFAFSLAIFFLGMSSAFLGGIVEKNVKKSALISMICFVSGLVLTGISVNLKSIIGIYLGYGVLMGIGLGVGYITPVKTLMMWFKDNKGLATGIAITGFGFASTIASPMITFLSNKLPLHMVFICLGIIYLIPLTISIFLLKKPYKDDVINNDFKYKNIIKDKTFIKIWFIMFINITCGLSLISIASMLLGESGIDKVMIATVISIMGIFNGAGRLVLSTISDKFKSRETMYVIIFIASVLVAFSCFIEQDVVLIVISLFIISSTYGAGFSCLPSLLSDKYGMNNISKIHGLCLTSWSMAGLCGNQLSSLIYNLTGSYMYIYPITVILYSIGLFLAYNIKKRKGNK